MGSEYVRAVVFDVGGVLRDSKAAMADSYRRSFAHVGISDIEIDADAIWNIRGLETFNGLAASVRLLLATRGKGLRGVLELDAGSDATFSCEKRLTEIVEQDASCADPSVVQNIISEYRRVFSLPEQAEQGRVRLYEGVEDGLWALHRLGYRLGVLSNGTHESLLRDLGHLASLFTIFVSDAAKPDPNVYSHAVSQQGLRPSEVVYVGDAASDIAMARAGGSKCVTLLSGMGLRQHLRGADFLFDDFRSFVGHVEWAFANVSLDPFSQAAHKMRTEIVEQPRKRRLCLAVYQGSGVPGDPQANMDILERVAKQASTKGAHILIAPELWTCGYNIDKETTHRLAEDRFAGPSLQCATEIARKQSLAVMLSYPERDSTTGRVYLSSALIDKTGSLQSHYRKVFLWSNHEKIRFNAGHPDEIVEQRIPEIEGIKVAMCICWDIEFPETVRWLAGAGAELLLSCANNTTEFSCHVTTACRAFENQIFVAYSNRVGSEGSLLYRGESCVIAPNGQVLARCSSTQEELIFTDILPDKDEYLRCTARNPYVFEIPSSLTLQGNPKKNR